jgi:preprotein translocase subunit SecE
VARDRLVSRRTSFRLASEQGRRQSPEPSFGTGPGLLDFGMANPFQYIQTVRSEAAKVTWPTRKETLVTTGMVIVMVILASVFFVSVDQTMHFAVGLVLGLGRN